MQNSILQKEKKRFYYSIIALIIDIILMITIFALHGKETYSSMVFLGILAIIFIISIFDSLKGIRFMEKQIEKIGNGV
ncbi:hypothetical protein [Campylobacter sp. US33a]|uniref:hypothetical protein n=1 Tax=Campylobacter sp. US33a TaxID=2498120 RepID=UPI0010680E23|nr:hypothetical protein [Campylobacter sp. US33a]TEY00693.1 hypothetical protein ELQ16_08645 [Campylobacter sp. US33a]